MVGKRAGEVAGKGEVNQVPAGAEEKAAESRTDKSTRDPRITRKQSGKFHFDLARFFRAALAPFLPRAVRVFLGRCAMVFFLCAALAAFLMFRFAAARCLLVVTTSRTGSSWQNFSARYELRCAFSGDVFACALLSSPQPNAIAQSVASPRALRVWTVLALMLTGGSRV